MCGEDFTFVLSHVTFSFLEHFIELILLGILLGILNPESRHITMRPYIQAFQQCQIILGNPKTLFAKLSGYS